jgi:TPR repeat protein
VQNYLRAVELGGDRRAMYNLGLCYQFGDGVELSGPKAMEWFKKAAAAGDRKSQAKIKRVSIGIEYLNPTKDELIEHRRNLLSPSGAEAK